MKKKWLVTLVCTTVLAQYIAPIPQAWADATETTEETISSESQKESTENDTLEENPLGEPPASLETANDTEELSDKTKEQVDVEQTETVTDNEENVKEAVKDQENQVETASKNEVSLKENSIGVQNNNPIRITKFSSPNKDYLTNRTNSSQLILEGEFSYTADTPAEGIDLEIELQNEKSDKDGQYYFNAPLPEQMTLGGGATLKNIETTENKVIVTLNLKGSANSSGNFTINYPFEESLYGWAPDGSSLGTLSLDAGEGTQTIELTSSNKTPLLMSVNPVASPSGDIAVGSSKVFGARVNDRPSGANNNLPWYYEPGSEISFIIEYPEGAEVSGERIAEATTITEDGRTKLIWDLGKVGADGIPEKDKWDGVVNGSNRFNTNNITITFPKDNFESGDQVDITAYSQYTLYGDGTPRTSELSLDNFVLDDNIEESTHITENTVTTLASLPLVSLGKTDEMTNYGGFARLSNGGTNPVPETKFTWINDEEQPANLVLINNSQKGVSFIVEYVLYFSDGSSVTRFNTGNLNVANVTPAGSYVTKLEMYALNNPNDSVADLTNGTAEPNRELPVGSEWSAIYPRYSTWENDEFPVSNKKIVNGDISNIEAAFSWKGEDKPDAHTAPALDDPTLPGGLASITFTDIPMTTVRYLGEAPSPTVRYDIEAGSGGSLTPGSSFNASLAMYQNATYSVGTWREPAAILMLPSALEVDETKPVEVVNNASGEVIDTATVTEIILPDGNVAYKLKPETLKEITATSYSSAPTFKFAIRVKEGTPSGTYYLSSGTRAYPTVAGRAFGISDDTSVSQVLSENAETSANYIKDEWDIDNNPNTTYHRISTTSPSIEVAALQDLRVDASLLDAESGEWNSLSNPGAQATVPLEGIGKIKLELFNTGNSYIGDLQLLDILPQVGDKMVSTNSDKGSQWDAFIDDLVVTVTDVDGNNVTDYDEHVAIQYDASNDPSFTSKNKNFSRSGSASFTGESTKDEAQSFLFELANNKRLAPGHKITIEMSIKAPAEATGSQIGEIAYNSFIVAGTHYENATGNAIITNAPNIEPNKQAFILAEAANASITNSGFIYKDLNNDGEYSAEDDKYYEGITVELFIVDEKGEVAAEPFAETITNEEGLYHFEGLYSNDYVVKIKLPNDDYRFIENGDSHVDESGYSPVIQVSPGEQKNVTYNAGIQVMPSVTVQFKADDELVGTAIQLSAEDLFPFSITDEEHNGTVVVGETPSVILPDGYQLIDNAEKDYTLTWDNPKTVVEYNIQKATYAVTFDTQGGMPQPEEQVINHGDLIEPPQVPVKDGYDFEGWFDEKGAIWNFETPVTGLVNLIAHWYAVEQTVSFDVNGGGDAESKPDDITAKTDEEIDLNEVIAPTRPGYTFTGWSDGDTVVEESIKVPAGGLTLTAGWTADEQTLTFDVNGGEETSKPDDITAKTDEEIDLNEVTAPTRAGYTFTGWSDGETVVEGLIKVPAGGLTLTAGWTADEQTVTFDVNGGEETSKPDDITAKTDEEIDLNEVTAPTRAGYSFTGWFDGEDSVEGVITVPAGGLTLKAGWTAEDQTISFDVNGGEEASKPDDITAKTDEEIDLNEVAAPTRAGYTFTGWSDGETVVEGLIKVPAGGLTLTAGWTADEQTVTFDVNGGDAESKPEDIIAKTDEEVDLSEVAAPTRAGYTFMGWYDGENEVLGTILIPSGGLTLIARWQPNDQNESEKNDNSNQDMGGPVISNNVPPYGLNNQVNSQNQSTQNSITLPLQTKRYFPKMSERQGNVLAAMGILLIAGITGIWKSRKKVNIKK